MTEVHRKGEKVQTRKIIENRAEIAKNKLLTGIKEAFFVKDYQKIFGEILSSRIIRNFAFYCEHDLELPFALIKERVMLGFFLFEREKNFLTEREIVDLKRGGLLAEFLNRGMQEKAAVAKVLEKYPV